MTTTISNALGHSPAMTQQGVGSTPGYDAIDARRFWGVAVQEGVITAGSYEVTQRGAGANLSVDIAASTGNGALVQGDAVTAQGLYFVAPHTAVINEAITTANATNPRIDQVVLEIKDTTHDASGSNLAQTARGHRHRHRRRDARQPHGRAALPASAILLADVLVAATDTAISNSEIRDRRPWARGAFVHIPRLLNAAAGTDYTTTSTSRVLIDSTNLNPRIECTGNPIRMRLTGQGSNSTGTTSSIFLAPFLDSAAISSFTDMFPLVSPAAGQAQNFSVEYTFQPAAGSHRLGWAWRVNAGTGTISASTSVPLVMTVEEIVRQTVPNNNTTTG
jgi:hypothetical protein